MLPNIRNVHCFPVEVGSLFKKILPAFQGPKFPLSYCAEEVGHKVFVRSALLHSSSSETASWSGIEEGRFRDRYRSRGKWVPLSHVWGVLTQI